MIRTRAGTVYKSGLVEEKPKPRIHGKWRAVVLNTYVSDDTENVSKHRVECDVIRVSNNVIYNRVPVMQGSHGVVDGAPWIPRPTTQNLKTQLPLNVTLITQTGRFNDVVTRLSDMDGDHVLIEFLEGGDPDFPCVVGAFSHRATKRKVTRGQGWSESDDKRGEPQSGEKYLRHGGTEARINESGDLLVNTEGANPTDVATETPTPLVGGNVRVKAKAGTSVTIETAGEDLVTIENVGGVPMVQVGGTAIDFVALATLVGAELAKVKAAVDAAVSILASAPPTPPDSGVKAFGAMQTALSSSGFPGKVAATKLKAE